MRTISTNGPGAGHDQAAAEDGEKVPPAILLGVAHHREELSRRDFTIVR